MRHHLAKNAGQGPKGHGILRRSRDVVVTAVHGHASGILAVLQPNRGVRLTGLWAIVTFQSSPWAAGMTQPI